ncbi:MAG: histidine phosphatase family protein [Cyclobacteriaceae bacterium]|nr:histidine phosphatase family protein [Cyclobacteriaceae bacterium]
MKTKKIYIVRHGETEFNRKGIVQGKGVNASLNTLGQKQAEAFYEAYKDEPFDLILTSTLNRSIESVTGFIELGIPNERLSALDEISWGVYEGKETGYEDKAFFLELTKRWTQEPDLAIEGGESPAEVAVRQQSAIEKIKETDAENILISMHGRAIRIFMTQLLDLPISEMDKFEHANLGLYELTYSDDRFTLVRENDVTHLKGIEVEM